MIFLRVQVRCIFLSDEYLVTKHTANRLPRNRCLGWRPYNPISKTWGRFEWMDYSTVQRRRANFGVGIRAINKEAGVQEEKYGVGLWCLNRPEWQLTGMFAKREGRDHC